MKPTKALITAVLTLCFILSLCACAQVPPPTEPSVHTDPSTVPTDPSEPPTESTPPPTEPAPAPEALYEDAKDHFDGLSELVFEYVYQEAKGFGRDTYTETREGTASYTGLESDKMEALLAETFTSGGYSTQYYESYLNGSGWSRVNNSSFRCPMTADDFLERQIPGLLLDQSLYGNFTAERISSGFILTFAGADRLESWVAWAEEATVISASGKLELDADGHLVKGQYHAEYTLGNTPYTLDVSVTLVQTEFVDFSTLQPVYPENAPEVEDPEILKHLLRTVGAVYAAPNMSVDCSDTVISQVVGQSRTQTSSYHFSGGSGDSLMANLNTQVTVKDSIGNTSTNSQTGVFRDGKYAYSYNGGTFLEDPTVNAESIRTTLEDSILSALITPTYIAGAQITDYGEQLVINFDGNQLLSASLLRRIYSLFSLDLDAIADSFVPGHITAHLTIEQNTGLPVAMGISLSRSHTFSGVTYQLTYELSQTISFSAAKAYESITGEPYITQS